jgi:hypothetical protein
MINRIKNILFTPKTEWPVIAGENKPHATVATTWVLLLALIPAVAALIGYGVVGQTVLGVKIGGTIGYGLRYAILQYVSMVIGIYVVALVIDLLAGSFGARKNFNQAFSLVAYAYTPTLVGGIFYILPSLSVLASLCGIYSLVLLYMGLKPMMQVPAEKQTGYFIVSLLVMILAMVVLSMILAPLIVGAAAVAAGV